MPTTMIVSIGGYRGDACICVLHKICIGGHVLENVLTLAVHSDGELKLTTASISILRISTHMG